MIILMGLGIIRILGSGQTGPRMLIPLSLVGKGIGPGYGLVALGVDWKIFQGGWRLEVGRGHADWSMGGIVGFGSFWRPDSGMILEVYCMN